MHYACRDVVVAQTFVTPGDVAAIHGVVCYRVCTALELLYF